MAIVSLDYRFVKVNSTLCQMVGYTEEELTSLSFPDITHPDDIDSDVQQAKRLADGDISFYKMDKRYIKKNKEVIWVTLTASIVRNKEGAPLYFLAMIEEITERKRIEEKQKERELLLEKQRNALLELTESRIMRDVDLKTAFEKITETSSRTLGVERVGIWLYDDDLLKIRCFDLYEQGPNRHSDGLELSVKSAPSYFKAMEERNSIVAYDAENDPSTREFVDEYLRPLGITSMLDVPIRLGGRIIGVLCHEHIGPMKRWSMEEQGFALAVADIVSLALANLKLRETLRNQAIRDPLTGLFNRRYMEESLKREMYRAMRRGTKLGIIMLDIDHFKRFNDTYGHAAGDALLQELGNFLQARIRKEDIACRYGGEEFTLILPDSSLEDTRRRAEELREEVKHLHVRYNGEPIGNVTLSLGVAVFPDHGETAETVLQTADWALYLAKEKGRDQVVVVGEALEKTAEG